MAVAEFRKFLRRSAQAMRSHPTDVERALWSRLRDLKRMGFDVIRFSNEEVRTDIDAVCTRILRIGRMPA